MGTGIITGDDEFLEMVQRVKLPLAVIKQKIKTHKLLLNKQV